MNKKVLLALIPTLVLAACGPTTSSSETPTVPDTSNQPTTPDTPSSEDKTTTEVPPTSEDSSTTEEKPAEQVKTLKLTPNDVPATYKEGGTKTVKSDKGDNIDIFFTETGNYSESIQLKKNAGCFYNETPLEKLSNIYLDIAKTGIKVAYGNTQNPTENVQVIEEVKKVNVTIPEGNSYFTISALNSACNLNEVIFTFNGVGTTPVPPTPTPDPEPDPDPTPDPDTSSSEDKPNQNPGEPVNPGGYEVPTEPLTGYYASIDPTTKGTVLLSSVRELIVSTHTTYTSYEECTGPNSKSVGKYGITDPHPDYPGKLLDFYTHAPIDDYWNANSNYNREHVWPQSLSGTDSKHRNWGEGGGGGDLQHIRPSFSDINGTRGNHKFGEAAGGRLVTKNVNGKTYEAAHLSGDTWEPIDAVKGDVARIILYCFVHYNSPENLEKGDGLDGAITSTASSRTSSLPVSITRVIDERTPLDCIRLLSEWNKLDPVDETEVTRNNGAYGIQHNRNAFIDHPWLVDAIWG